MRLCVGGGIPPLSWEAVSGGQIWSCGKFVRRKLFFWFFLSAHTPCTEYFAKEQASGGSSFFLFFPSGALVVHPCVCFPLSFLSRSLSQHTSVLPSEAGPITSCSLLRTTYAARAPLILRKVLLGSRQKGKRGVLRVSLF